MFDDNRIWYREDKTVVLGGYLSYVVVTMKNNYFIIR